MRHFVALFLLPFISAQTPTITRIFGQYGADPSRLLTGGGEQLVLEGSNFGTSGAQLTYTGPSPFQNGFTIKYTPLITQQNATAIQFTTSPGIGSNLQFTVTTSTTASITSPPLASYAPPLIINITVPPTVTTYTTQTLRPTGTDTIVINAQNLGPRTYPGFPNIYMPTVRFGGTTGTYGYLNSCTRSTTTFDRQIICRVPVGGGTNHTVRVQSGVTGQWSAVNLKILISYVTPTIVSTSPTVGFMNTAGFEQIVIRGQNMPFPSWVIAGFCPITASFGPYSSTIEYNSDRAGGDLPGSPIQLPTSDPQLCIAECKKNILCQAWALSQIGCGTTTRANCWLKGSVPSKTSATCIISGQTTPPPFKTAMRSCTGAFDTDGRTPVITCQTPPGTGTGYALSVNVGNIFTNTLANRVIGYAPPIIYNYAGASDDASTLGNQTVLINGQNFGSNTSLVKATYTLSLKQLTSNQSQIIYTSPRCNITIANTQLGCITAPGVGQNLGWNVIVDGQNNVNPTTAYIAPQISAYQIYNGSFISTIPTSSTPISNQIMAASTSGGDLLYILGSGFGFPALNLIQSIFMQSPYGTLIPLQNYSLVSDSLIIALLPKGGGTGWQTQIKIADILNIPSSANFSYANPSVLSISPLNGPTSGGTTILVRAQNLAQDYINIVTVVAFGNPSDGSVYSSFINTSPYFLSNTSSNFASDFLTFVTPPGVGALRQVRLVSYLATDLQPDISSIPLTPTNANDLFTYSDPLITNAVLSLPQTASQIQWATNFFGTTDGVSVLTLYGLNFGQATAPLVSRIFEYQNVSTWGPASNFYFDLSQWTDTTLTLYTQTPTGSIRLIITSLDPNSQPIIQTSNGYAYSNLSPLISTNNNTLYPTVGNVILELQVYYLSAATGLNISLSTSTTTTTTSSITSTICPVVDPDTLQPLNPQDIYSRVINNPTQYRPAGPFTSATQWTVKCILPPGQGSAAPIILTRLPDAAQSQPLPIGFIPPTISIMNGQAAGSINRILSSTQGSQLDIYGSNLGPCPTISIATYIITTCTDPTSILIPEQTYIQVRIPEGEGIGLELNPPNGWQIQLTAGDQLATPFLFGWQPPTLTSLSAPFYPTIGGTLITIQGQNFGSSLPTYPQILLPQALQVQVLLNNPQATTPLLSNCLNPQRLSHTIITCILPEGAGYITTGLSIAGQPSTNTLQFHYDNPIIQTAAFNTSINTTLNMPSTGVLQFYIFGNNFGPNPTNSCVFVQQAPPPSSTSLQCNGLEDYPGEGEVPASDISSWNHTQIVFNFPPGTGRPQIYVSAATVFSISPLNSIAYAPPQINALSTYNGPADGNYPITIKGSGFGQLTIVQPSVYPLALPLQPNQRFYNPVQLIMSGLCISQAPRLGCQTLITNYIDSALTFTMPPGIGTNYTFEVQILTPTSPNIFSTQVTLWSYDPPQITGFNPNPVYVGQGTNSPIVISGNNFGKTIVFTYFPNADPTINILVDNIQQVQPTRIQRNNIDVGIQFALTAQLTAGYKSTQLQIANQWTASLNTSFQALTIYCQTNYFARNAELCLPCPSGGICPGSLDYPSAAPGFYNINSTSSPAADPCPSSNLIIDPITKQPRDVCILACSPSSACVGNNMCAFGYQSTAPVYRCNSCSPNFYKRANDCIQCPNSPLMLVIGFLLILITLAAAGYFLNKYNVNMAFISIAIDYFQVISIFMNSKIQWPATIKNLMYVLSAFNLNIDIVAPECLVPNINYEQKFYFIMLTPLALFGLLLTGNLFYVAYKYFILQRKRKDLLNHTSTLKSSALILMYFFYLYLTRTVMDVFNCTPTIPPSTNADGVLIKYMSVQFEQCGKPGGLQLRLMPFAIIALVFYSLGFPAALASILYKNHELIILDQLLRAKGVHSDRFNNPHAYTIRKTFSRLYYQFKPHFFYWALMVLARKFCIAITSVIFATNSSFQMAACLLILFLAYSAQSQFRPFMCYDDFDEVLDEHNKLADYLPLHAKLKAMMNDTETRNLRIRHKNILTRTGAIDKIALYNSISRWFFNYNTVESTMLFSGVIVCLMGIMYQSDTIASGQDTTGQDAITGVILTVLISSIMYLASVFGFEIYIALKSKSQKSLSPIISSIQSKSHRHLEPTDSISNESNPLMLQQSLEKQFNLKDYEDPPPKIVWQMFKDLFEKQQQDLHELNMQANELKKMQQKYSIIHGEIEMSPLHTYRKPIGRQSFAPKGPDKPT